MAAEKSRLKSSTLWRPARFDLPNLDGRALRLFGLALDGQRQRLEIWYAFTVSIEAAEGVTTGISAYDRATTILKRCRPCLSLKT